MELSVIFVYFGRRCWCHWTLTSQGEERQAAESKPGFLRLKVAVICVHGSQAQLQPGCVQGRARGPQPLGDMIKTQAELPFLWLCPLALSSLQGGKKILGGKKNPSWRTALDSMPTWDSCWWGTTTSRTYCPFLPRLLHPWKNCEKTKSWWAANKNERTCSW